MKISTLSKLLYAAYHPNQFMARRFPKAAKRARIRKKWRNRIGCDDIDISSMFYDANVWWKMLPKETGLTGGDYVFPVIDVRYLP